MNEDISMFPIEQQEIIKKQRLLRPRIKEILSMKSEDITQELYDEANMLIKESARLSMQLVRLQGEYLNNDSQWVNAAENLANAVRIVDQL